MHRMLVRSGLILCLIASAAGLRSRGSSEVDVGQPTPYRQKLGNQQDMQYFGQLSLGKQSMKGIFDTGSFELLVFTRECKGCGTARAYEVGKYPTFKPGSSHQVHAYGSGQCEANDGFEEVQIGGMTAKQQPFWFADDCTMPLLEEASFNAIIGIGPPGQPAFTAREALDELKETEKSYRRRHQAVPPSLKQQIAEEKKTLKVARGKKALLESFGTTTFSVCLGRQPDSPGFLIWNDKTRKGQPHVMQIPVAGKITWGVTLKDWSFGGSTAACADGCGAVVDSGTSLFAVPTPIYNAIWTHFSSGRYQLDCSDLRGFPDLVMTVGGKTLRFPPYTYVGELYGQMNKEAEGFLSMNRLGHRSKACHLLLIDLGPTRDTGLGPMLILGMPFFREYYTTFDLGSGRDDRSIFVSTANEDCDPEAVGDVSTVVDRLASSLRFKPRSVNVSQVRVPEWLKPGNGVRF
uniref:Peptidase A1 domain-containing protein n=1 Tax=Alexandrium monilatum TaxID=311494 RepID=A0A7S4VWU4_9DINO|mmetsp:Transcript_92861/g.277065  ORF Transcript_92861/g.277065 Transcript_92861/m.277065 type:complete len:462 (-) Transcript_92861:60-1445(-)|eukprot:CAMPEP_0175702218 /NCGR_PEP_ID=MMETSP0097-20121207/35891_1 /TAXON_ID=311494 /ORGANISM="Alexandrium monilatum, Strain CCMP3105" /LENGTH=461 /DNA_ID=CAMNT_0017009475 /DNA_START=47 /DNA_END=1432 /DNA_ORIENTATION=+